jgi:hypothetical protein
LHQITKKKLKQINNMEKENPSYYAIIPASVRYADIPDKAKLLYGEITALCNKEGYCWANNIYFANLYQVHKNTISRLIGILAKNNFINIQITPQQKGVEVSRKLFIPILKNVEGGILKNVEDNNTSINIKKNKGFSQENRRPYFMNKPMTQDLKLVIWGQNDLRTFVGKKDDIEWR